MDAATMTTFGIITAALLALYGTLWRRLSLLEGRVSLLTDLTRQCWQWGQKVIQLYARHARDGAPELPPFPTEQAAD